MHHCVPSLPFCHLKSEESNEENAMMEGITSSFYCNTLLLYCLHISRDHSVLTLSSFNNKYTHMKTHRHTRMSLLNETRDSVCALRNSLLIS